ncbi:polysaccharide biosynthesis/export family protein [Brevundimonas sp. VNH65]|uniref:polysaccharide biosynthesis/export family protein n=1 Tax=Brevundimonas sp. VNH65 TaxID=3400917 RepID=UPI003C06491B
MASTWRFVLISLALLASAACATAPEPSPIAQMADPVRQAPIYRLGAADKLRITVFGEEALSGEFLVNGSGQVSMPLIGEIQATGLSLPEFQDRVSRALAEGYINEPRVSVEVLNYRPFYILGEVKKPGEYPYTSALTVVNAVATAEGFTYRADTRRVFIKRADSNAEQPYPLTTAIQVAPGDTIRIGERFF